MWFQLQSTVKRNMELSYVIYCVTITDVRFTIHIMGMCWYRRTGTGNASRCHHIFTCGGECDCAVLGYKKTMLYVCFPIWWFNGKRKFYILLIKPIDMTNACMTMLGNELVTSEMLPNNCSISILKHHHRTHHK